MAKIYLRVFSGFVLIVSLLFHQGCKDSSLETGKDFDVVIVNGRVTDPESNLDEVRNIGIRDGVVQVMTAMEITGKTRIDATDLVVAPGFIDIHQHGQDMENYTYKVMDGVTTVLELEMGTADVGSWYGEREGRTLINFGVSAGHVPLRMRIMDVPCCRHV